MPKQHTKTLTFKGIDLPVCLFEDPSDRLKDQSDSPTACFDPRDATFKPATLAHVPPRQKTLLLSREALNTHQYTESVEELLYFLDALGFKIYGFFLEADETPQPRHIRRQLGAPEAMAPLQLINNGLIDLEAHERHEKLVKIDIASDTTCLLTNKVLQDVMHCQHRRVVDQSLVRSPSQIVLHRHAPVQLAAWLKYDQHFFFHTWLWNTDCLTPDFWAKELADRPDAFYALGRLFKEGLRHALDRKRYIEHAGIQDIWRTAKSPDWQSISPGFARNMFDDEQEVVDLTSVGCMLSDLNDMRFVQSLINARCAGLGGEAPLHVFEFHDLCGLSLPPDYFAQLFQRVQWSLNQDARFSDPVPTVARRILKSKLPSNLKQQCLDLFLQHVKDDRRQRRFIVTALNVGLLDQTKRTEWLDRMIAQKAGALSELTRTEDLAYVQARTTTPPSYLPIPTKQPGISDTETDTETDSNSDSDAGSNAKPKNVIKNVQDWIQALKQLVDGRLEDDLDDRMAQLQALLPRFFPRQHATSMHDDLAYLLHWTPGMHANQLNHLLAVLRRLCFQRSFLLAYAFKRHLIDAVHHREDSYNRGKHHRIFAKVLSAMSYKMDDNRLLLFASLWDISTIRLAPDMLARCQALANQFELHWSRFNREKSLKAFWCLLRFMPDGKRDHAMQKICADSKATEYLLRLDHVGLEQSGRCGFLPEADRARLWGARGTRWVTSDHGEDCAFDAIHLDNQCALWEASPCHDDADRYLVMMEFTKDQALRYERLVRSQYVMTTHVWSCRVFGSTACFRERYPCGTSNAKNAKQTMPYVDMAMLAAHATEKQMCQVGPVSNLFDALYGFDKHIPCPIQSAYVIRISVWADKDAPSWEALLSDIAQHRYPHLAMVDVMGGSVETIQEFMDTLVDAYPQGLVRVRLPEDTTVQVPTNFSPYYLPPFDWNRVVKHEAGQLNPIMRGRRTYNDAAVSGVSSTRPGHFATFSNPFASLFASKKPTLGLSSHSNVSEKVPANSAEELPAEASCEHVVPEVPQFDPAAMSSFAAQLNPGNAEAALTMLDQLKPDTMQALLQNAGALQGLRQHISIEMVLKVLPYLPIQTILKMVRYLPVASIARLIKAVFASNVASQAAEAVPAPDSDQTDGVEDQSLDAIVNDLPADDMVAVLGALHETTLAPDHASETSATQQTTACLHQRADQRIRLRDFLSGCIKPEVIDDFAAFEALLADVRSQKVAVATTAVKTLTYGLLRTCRGDVGSHARRPCYLIDDASALRMDEPHACLNQAGQPIKTCRTPLDAFLEEAAHSDSRPLLLIHWDAFSPADQVAMNGMLDDARMIKGRPIPDQVQIIGLLKTPPEDASFFSRHDRVVALHATVPTPPANLPSSDPIVLDVRGMPDWESTLFGGISLQHNRITWQSGPLVDALRDQQPCQIQIKHLPAGPDGMARCRTMLKRAVASGVLTCHEGFAIDLHPETDFHIVDEPFVFRAFQPVQVQRDVCAAQLPSQDICWTNTRLFDYLLRIKKLDDTSQGIYSESLGWLASHAGGSLPLYVSTPLSDSQWYCICVLAETHQVGLQLYLAPGVDLPAGLPITEINQAVVEVKDELTARCITIDEADGQRAAPLVLTPAPDPSQATLPVRPPTVIVTDDVTQIQDDIAPKPLVIPMEDMRWGTLIGEVTYDDHASGYQNFQFHPSDYLAALQGDRPVLLRGRIADRLLMDLHPLLAGHPMLLPNGNTFQVTAPLCVHYETDQPLSLQARTFEPLAYLGDRVTLQPTEALAQAREAKVVFQESPAQSENVDLEDSASATRVFYQKRMDALDEALSTSHAAQLIGPTGVGKSSFMHSLGNLAPVRYQVYDDLDALEAWSQDDATRHTPILFLDEVNIIQQHLTCFEAFAALAPGDTAPQEICLGAKIYQVSDRHRIVVANNPVTYGGRFAQILFQRVPVPQLRFEDFPAAVLYEQMIQPIARRRVGESDVLLKRRVKPLIGHYLQARLAVEDKADASEQALADKKRPTVRTLQHDVLMSTYRNLPADSVNMMSAHGTLSSDFVPPQSSQTAQKKLSDFIALHRSQFLKQSVGSGLGLNACLVEGAPGSGKSASVRYQLESAGYALYDPQATSTETVSGLIELVHAHQPTLRYLKLDASMSTTALEASLLLAYRAGMAVWMDEADSIVQRSGLERVLNDLLTGFYPGGQLSALQPGFMVLMTGNGAALAGRRPLSPALRHRAVEISFPMPNEQDVRAVTISKWVRAHRTISACPVKRIQYFAEDFNVCMQEMRGVNLRTLSLYWPTMLAFYTTPVVVAHTTVATSTPDPQPGPQAQTTAESVAAQLSGRTGSQAGQSHSASTLTQSPATARAQDTTPPPGPTPPPSVPVKRVRSHWGRWLFAGVLAAGVAAGLVYAVPIYVPGFLAGLALFGMTPTLTKAAIVGAAGVGVLVLGLIQWLIRSAVSAAADTPIQTHPSDHADLPPPPSPSPGRQNENMPAMVTTPMGPNHDPQPGNHGIAPSSRLD